MQRKAIIVLMLLLAGCSDKSGAEGDLPPDVQEAFEQCRKTGEERFDYLADGSATRHENLIRVDYETDRGPKVCVYDPEYHHASWPFS